MSTTIQEAITQVAPAVGQIIVSGYGEPLTDPQCIPFLRELDRLNIVTSMSTNGIALTPAIARQLASLQYLGHLNISIDSPDPQIYREIRGDELGKALRGVSNLMSAIDRPDRVTVSSILMRRNIASLHAFPAILSQLGVQKYVLQGLLDYNSAVQAEHLLYQEDAFLHIERIREACRQAHTELLFTMPDRLELELYAPLQVQGKYYRESSAAQSETRQCTLPWELPFVDKDGRVFSCCYAATQRLAVMGDMRETDLATIWNGPAYREFRQALVDGRALPDICRSCSAVPWGEHPLDLYAAQILIDESVLNDHVAMKLVVRNSGTSLWTQDTLIRIGTARPRDRTSAYLHPSWLSANRIATFRESNVPPGGKATFVFHIRPQSDVPSESFQLVADGKCWLPNTQFEVRPGSARRNPLNTIVRGISLRVLRPRQREAGHHTAVCRRD